ncbi:MAG: Rrf2 family transcriptional regulator [Polyangiaceae bacterium]|nr:Rrf2 family transcriptional regulator [Polyangiaceae bacterium]
MSYPTSYSQAVLILVFVADKIRQGLYEHVPTRAVAESLGIPTPTVAKILQSLVRAGYIETQEGAKGGVRLALPASKISLADVLHAMELKRPLFQTHQRVRAKGERPTKAQAAIQSALTSAEGAMRQSLAQTSIEQLLTQFGK